MNKNKTLCKNRPSKADPKAKEKNPPVQNRKKRYSIAIKWPN